MGRSKPCSDSRSAPPQQQCGNALARLRRSRPLSSIPRIVASTAASDTSVTFAPIRSPRTVFSVVLQTFLNFNSKDRRRRKRQLLNASVRITWGSRSLDALGINLSDVGMCLFAAANLPMGSEVELAFLPRRGSRRVQIRGTVRHRALYLYGIEFHAESDQPGATEQAADCC